MPAFRITPALTAAALLSIASPVLAQADPAPPAPAPAADAKLPRCSATVTDHCMQRGGDGPAAPHRGGMHHAGTHHHHHGKKLPKTK